MPRLDRLSILVVSWNGRQHLVDCLPAIAAQRRAGVEVETLLLDNGSSDGTAEFVRAHYPDVRLVESASNLGFAGGNNRLAEVASGDALLLVNNDTRAEPGWIEAMVDAYRTAPADVAAISGTIVDWNGEQLDFGRGIQTFDGHALPVDQGRPLSVARRPRTGEELPFGCGGNLLVGRDAFLAAGGFDERYFAYFEDVDLGWRLWAGGERIVACSDGVVRHRLSATSSRFGHGRRGALLERNALWTVVKNYETGLRERMLPLTLLTYLARLDAMIAEETGSPVAASLPLGAGRPEPPRRVRESLVAKLRRLGLSEFTRRATRKILRAARARRSASSPSRERIELSGNRALAQLSGLAGLLAGLDAMELEHEKLERRRKRSDLELFERFPLWIVPTYPGDARLFESEAFARWLPADLRFERAALAEVLVLR